MTDNQKLKLGMYESVISYLQENRDITSTVRGFNSSITRLRKRIDDIKQKEKELSSDILEKTIVSSRAKEDLIVMLVPLAQSLFYYAKRIEDIQLKEKVRLSHSSFERLRDSQLLDKALMLHALCQTYREEVKSEKMNISDPDVIYSRILTFRNSLDEKINTFISSDAMVSINALFAAADEILNMHMDRYMELLSDYTEFYDDYLVVRSLEYQDLKNELQESEEDEQ